MDAEAAEAPGLAAGVVDWLVGEEIVVGELSDCSFGGPGRRPGRFRRKALEDVSDADGEWAKGRFATKGLRVDVGRRVYHNLVSGVSDAGCPKCGHNQLFREYSAAFDDWYVNGVTDHGCPSCDRRSPINDWILEPQWEVGHLELTFWNWPPLSERFRRDVCSHLNGHRLVYLCDKM